MGKHTPEFKAQVLDSIGKIGLKETIKHYCANYNIRPEIIRIWADPEKLKKARERALEYYKINSSDPQFLEKRRQRSLAVYLKNKSVADLVYSYTKDEQIREFNNLKILAGSYDGVACYNRIVLSNQPHFYEVENKMWKDINIRNSIYSNRKKYINKEPNQLNDKEILRGFKISGTHVGFSHFSPLWIKKFIEDHNIKSLYDPCGGWGHRLLGCMNIRYIYNDCNINTFNGVQNIIKDFNITNAVCYNNRAESFTPTDDYESVFTCPPYFNKEIYSEDTIFTDIESYGKWWDSVVMHATKPSVKYFGFVINQTYKQILIDNTIKHGWKLTESSILNRQKSHLTPNVSNHEEVLVFAKYST